jgi:tetratricopeptide (TPR) repeat protein
LYFFQAQEQVDCYSQSKDIVHVSDAISLIRKGIAHNPEDENLLLFLSTALAVRFYDIDAIDAIDDISEAISLLERVGLEKSLSSLSTLYLRRFKLLQNLEDLSKAISAKETLIRLTPDNHESLPKMLDAVTSMLYTRFRITENVEDLSLFIARRRKRVEMRLPGDKPYLRLLVELAYFQFKYFQCTQELQDLEKAITSSRTVQSLYADDEEDEVWSLLYITLWIYSEKMGDDSLKEAAKEVVNKAIIQGNFSPKARLIALRVQSTLSLTSNNPSDALDAADLSIRLLSEFAALSQPIQTRHSVLSHQPVDKHEWSKLLGLDTLDNIFKSSSSTVQSPPSTLGGLALFHNRPDLALEWLERGRCLVWNQLKQLRTPVEELRAQDPVLADRFLKLSEDLEAAAFRTEKSLSPPLSIFSQISNYDDATGLDHNWNQLLEDIREKNQNFLRPPTSSDILGNLPSLGPVIIINVSIFLCTALALLPGNDKPILIDLPDFSYSIAETMHTHLTSYLVSRGLLVRASDSEDRGSRALNNLQLGQNVMHTVLKRLWVLVVKPILDALGYSVSCVPIED